MSQTLPEDRTAERALLGACILSPAAAETAIDMLDPNDFFDVKHKELFAAIVAQVRLGSGRVDVVRIASAVGSDNEHLPYLHELQNDTPTVSNAAHYAEVIAGHALRREAVRVAAEIQREAMECVIDPGDVAEHARERFADLDMPTRIGLPDPDVQSFMASVDMVYDWLIPDLLERRDRMLVTAGEGVGKALACHTPIPTPTGWTTMGQLQPGDEVFAPDGQPTTVVGVTEPWWGDCYRLEFDDRSEIVADANHLWLTETLAAREDEAYARRRPAETKPRGTDQRSKRQHFPAVVTTEQIRATLRARGGHALNHSIETSSPVDPPAADLPISPYTFGAWLGDGTSRWPTITCADEQIIDEIRAEGWTVTKAKEQYLWRIKGGKMRDGFQARCIRLGVLGDKHIPAVYQRASASQRLAVLQGLMDTDGTVAANDRPDGRSNRAARCELTLSNKRLAHDALDLALSLGIKATMRESDSKLNGRTVGTRWRIGFQTDLPVFRLQRKADRLTPLRTRRSTLRYITAVEPSASVPVRCIQVDRPDGMFLAGEQYIPTHNSVFLRQLAVQTAAGIHPWTGQPMTPRNVLLVDLENSNRQVSRALTHLVRQAGTKLDPARLRVASRAQGIDLTTRTDRRWLLERCLANKAELLVIGPLYRMHAGVAARGDIGGEDAARKVTAALDDIRMRTDVALLMETHAPHGDGMMRDLRPFGSSVWLRWPEFGVGIRLDPDSNDPDRYVLKHWRGPRDARVWPKRLLKHAGRWPWTPDALPTGTAA